MVVGPLEIVRQVVAILDDLDIPYALGGSVASSFFGEPRSTVDVDVAVLLPDDRAEALLDRASDHFYVPSGSAREAVEAHTSFNLVDTANGFKVDVFVLGDALLDRRQIERRVSVSLPGSPERPVWVTAPEDQVLRKLDWYRAGGSLSDRQWRDVIGILQVQEDLDVSYMEKTARASGLYELLTRAMQQA